MLYRVRANHLICVDLGVLGYLGDGDWFLQMVIKYIRTIPRLHIALPVEALDDKVLDTRLAWAMLTYTREVRFPGTRSDHHQLNEYLKTLNDEYRRWKFDSMMDTSSDIAMYDDLKPLLEVYDHYRAQGESSWMVLREYANDLMHRIICDAVREHFAEPMNMFMTVHKEKVSAFELYVHFPPEGSSALDLKLLVEIPEE